MPSSKMKNSLLAVARRLRVLPLLEYLRYRQRLSRNSNANATFLAQHPDFVPPPSWWMHDMYSDTSYHYYWTSGARDAAYLLETIERYRESPVEDIVEWGCGLARILRHIPSRINRTGFDYNVAAIDWGNAFVPGVEFKRNRLSPPLERDDASVDVVYAISVFTHLSEAVAIAWVREIKRILRPGGLFLFSVHGDGQTASLSANERRVFDKHRPVYRAGVKEGSRIYTSYHPDRYVAETLMSPFEVVAGPENALGQTLWIAKKPPKSTQRI